LPRIRWRTWLGWSLLASALVGLGGVLHATLPAQPCLVLRGDSPNNIEAGVLSPDGAILTTGTMVPNVAPADNFVCASLKTWDTAQGKPRGEFFRGLVGADSVTMWGFPVKVPSDPDARGFNLYDLKYSPDRRYCALLHGDGLALADLHSGREHRLALKVKIEEFACPESAWYYRRLHRPMETKKLQVKQQLREALGNLHDDLGGYVVGVNREAFDVERGEDFVFPSRQEVCLPAGPSKMIAWNAIHLLMAQVGLGAGELMVRRDGIEFTTAKCARVREVSPPVFSPRGSLVVLAVAEKSEVNLHIIDCASGQHIASLPVHPQGFGLHGFTSDEELLYYFANHESTSLLSVWDTRQKRVVRTFKDAGFQGLETLAPDGVTLPAINEAGDLELLNLQTGARRVLFPIKNDVRSERMFSPNGRTLVQMNWGELELWDVATGKQRSTIKVGQRDHWPGLFMSADSRLVSTFDSLGKPRFRTWSATSGECLFARPATEPDDSLASIERFGTTMDDDSPRFTPDRRFLIKRLLDRVDILDPASGNRQASLILGGRAINPRVIAFTPDGRFMLSYWDYPARPPGFLENWLGRLWPAPRATIPVVVSEVATGQVRLRAEVRQDGLTGLALSDDGRIVMASWRDGNTDVITCWEVPGRPSMLLVVGIPLALGGVSVLMRWWSTRKKATNQATPAIQ